MKFVYLKEINKIMNYIILNLCEIKQIQYILSEHLF